MGSPVTTEAREKRQETEPVQVSVIIASYNSGKTIKKTLRSLEMQTNRDFEIIVVDSSTDHTAKKIQRDFPNVKVIRFFERKFPGDARNIGISKAKGRIIAFVDADCEANNDWIERIVNAHKSSYPAIGGAIANGTQGNHLSWAAYFCEYSQWMPGTSAQWMEDVAAANMSYKKSIFDKYGGFIEGTYCSDTEFHWRLAKDGIRIRFDPSLLVVHHSIDTFGRYLRHECFHGRCFARLRSNVLKFSLVKRSVYAVLFVLLALRLFYKIAYTNVKNRTYWPRFLKSIPFLILGVGTWSFGEGVGYILKGPHRSTDIKKKA